MAETDTAAPTEPAYRKLTPAEWEQVVVLWESGTVTLQDLSDRFGITKPALHEGLKKKGAVKGARSKEFAKVAEDSLKTEALRRMEAIKDFRGNFQKYGDFIMSATMKELSELMKESPRSRETQRRIFTCLKYSAEIYAIVNREKHILFELDKDRNEDGDLPEITVVQYDPEEIEKIKSRFDVPAITLFEEDAPMSDALSEIEELARGGD
jgi:hypothetical protein